jgi:hypothetical protein
MTVHANATNETTTFIFYKSNVAELSGVCVEDLERFHDRLAVAYDMGEPVWMVADEMKLRVNAPRPRKTPRQLAIRVVQF